MDNNDNNNTETDPRIWAEKTLDAHLRINADNGRRTIVVDPKHLFTSIDSSDTLHELVRQTLSERPMFAPEREAAQAFYAELKERLNREMVENYLHGDDEDDEQWLSDEEIAEKERFAQAELLMRFLFETFIDELKAGKIAFSGKRFEASGAIWNVAREAVNGKTPVHVLTGDIEGINIINPELQGYGADSLEAVWFAPLQVDNHNTEGEKIGFFVDELYQVMRAVEDPNVTASECTELINDLVDNTPKAVAHLFTSQGYTLTDILDQTKRENSTFLTTFAQEVENLPRVGGYAPLAFLTAVTAISARDIDALMTSRANAIVIPAPTQANPDNRIEVGLFDPTMGGGSAMTIELERDWIIPVTPEDLRANFSGLHPMEHNDYGYSPEQVYGNSYFPREARVVKLP